MEVSVLADVRVVGVAVGGVGHGDVARNVAVLAGLELGAIARVAVHFQRPVCGQSAPCKCGGEREKSRKRQK